MIISHEHRFIFIKNRKVGSTSTELALQPICGPEDVLTPDHIYRSRKDVLAPQARNYDGPHAPWRELAGVRTPMDAARIVRDKLKRPAFYNHIRASSVRARVPRAVWDGYYKFCFERNPWDKVVSFYHWYGQGKDLPPVDEFVREHRKFGTVDQTLPTDWSRYTSRDRVIVDDVLDYADLEGGLRTALARAGVPEDIASTVSLGNEKAKLRPRDEVVLSPESDAVIRSVFAREIERFDFCASPAPGIRVA